MRPVGELLLKGASFSGGERNRLFRNVDGSRFADVSGVSGVDHVGDSRSVAVLDFDRDGWQDMLVVNVSSPQLLIYHNEIGTRAGGDNTTLMDYLGSVDPEIESLADVLDLTTYIDSLNQQEKKTLFLRYRNGLSQSETAAVMGVSQMQISRLQRNALGKLRDVLQGQSITC